MENSLKITGTPSLEELHKSPAYPDKDRLYKGPVTIIEGKGKSESIKNLLFIQLKRKKIPAAIKLIKEYNPEAYITINDIKTMLGGYIK